MTEPDIPDHVRRNRDYWDAMAGDWVKPGRNGWQQAEPTWGLWQIPDAESGLLDEVEGLDVLDKIESTPVSGESPTTRIDLVKVRVVG